MCLVEGTTGVIGGSISHEYHLISNVGEDKLVSCLDCGAHFNEQLVKNDESSQYEDYPCVNCNSNNIKKQLGIEVSSWPCNLFEMSNINCCK